MMNGVIVPGFLLLTEGTIKTMRSLELGLLFKVEVSKMSEKSVNDIKLWRNFKTYVPDQHRVPKKTTNA